MTVAPERPCPPVQAQPGVSLIELAEACVRALPGHKVEILGGQLLVTPSADGPHGLALTNLVLDFAPLHDKDAFVIQSLGLWLPTGDDDHAVPDLSIVDRDFEDHEMKFKCYDPGVFRLVLEITSQNWREDLHHKPELYARAGIPVYVIGDREHEVVIVYTDPRDDSYRTRSVYKGGESFTLPESIGTKIELKTDTLLRRGSGRTGARARPPRVASWR